MPRARGAFIVFEGCDRAGKSTQCERLIAKLRQENKVVHSYKFPDRSTTIGKMIDQYLRQTTDLNDHMVHLLFSANRWELMAQIHDDLDAGITVVADRYAYSGVAFTYAKQIIAANAQQQEAVMDSGGLTLEWCKAPDHGLLKPDLVLFLDLSIEDAKLRGGFGQERYEHEQMQIAVRQIFHDLGRGEDRWKQIDASKSIDDVSFEIDDVVSNLVVRLPLTRLW